MGIRFIFQKIVRPYGKGHFLLRHGATKNIRVLDVGCGNNSVKYVKKHCPDCYYIGLDVADCNLDDEAKLEMEEYHVVSAENFAEKIREFENTIDIVISSHNIEHCNEPQKVLNNMIRSLKSGGGIYMSFPSEKSVTFPNRAGCLNFYDDGTHACCPVWDNIIQIFKENNMSIAYSCPNYSPIILRIVGKLNEKKSQASKKTLMGTWEYYGFESIIWGEKK